MSLSSVDPYTRIRQLERQVCCLKKDMATEFFSPSFEVINFDDCEVGAYLTTGGVKIGVGVALDTFADLEALADALNTAYTGFATFTVVGETLKIVTTLFYEDIVLVIGEDCP